MDGRAYNKNQGVGYATVLGDSKAIDDLAQGALMSKKKSGKGGFDAGEVWHYYTGATQQAVNKWYDDSAKLMTDSGINDIWNSSDEKAIQQQIKASNIHTAINNISQAQELYNKAIDDIGTRGDKYTEEYIEEVMNFPKTVSFEQMASGEFQFPAAKFREPITIYNDYFVKESARIAKETKGEYTGDDIYRESVIGYFSSPENQANARALKQMVVKVNEADRKELTRIKEDQGFEEEWQALAFKNLKAMHHFESKNAMTEAVRIGDLLPIDQTSWKKAEAGVTQAGFTHELSAAGRKAAEDHSKSFFATNAYLLKDEGFMKQLGIDMDQSIAGREKDAVDEFTNRIINSVAKKSGYTHTKTQDAGLTQEQQSESFDNWYRDLMGGDDTVSEHAANWLFGKSTMGKIQNAKVKKFDPIISSEAAERGEVAFGTDDVLEVTFENSKAAKAAREKSLKLLLERGADDATYQSMKDFYEQDQGGRSVYVPLGDEFVQIAKELHNQSASSKKLPYKREIDRGTSDPLNFNNQSNVDYDFNEQ